uniref:Uncharacterized protein n=1 Tax=Rhizophora mucronata TaxID=61149 RepID=A0A2P2KB90_RHIMU
MSDPQNQWGFLVNESKTFTQIQKFSAHIKADAFSEQWRWVSLDLS